MSILQQEILLTFPSLSSLYITEKVECVICLQFFNPG